MIINYKLTSLDWKNIFERLGIKGGDVYNTHTKVYSDFIRFGSANKLFSPALEQKINYFDSHNPYITKTQQLAKWGNYFNEDFNLKDHFFIFSLTSENKNTHTSLCNYIEKISNKETLGGMLTQFLSINAHNYPYLMQRWMSLVEKKVIEVQPQTIKAITDKYVENRVARNSPTQYVVSCFKVMAFTYKHLLEKEPIEQFLKDFSHDAFFTQKASKILAENKIDVALPIVEIPLIKKETLKVTFELDENYYIQKFNINPTEAQDALKSICTHIANINYSSEYQKEITNKIIIAYSPGCYNYTAQRVQETLKKFDNLLPFYLEKTVDEDMNFKVDFIKEFINKVDFMAELDKSLPVKILTEKKAKI